jgi:hypothetical protein
VPRACEGIEGRKNKRNGKNGKLIQKNSRLQKYIFFFQKPKFHYMPTCEVGSL